MLQGTLIHKAGEKMVILIWARVKAMELSSSFPAWWWCPQSCVTQRFYFGSFWSEEYRFQQRLARWELLGGPSWGQSKLQGSWNGPKGRGWRLDLTEGRAWKGQSCWLLWRTRWRPNLLSISSCSQRFVGTSGLYHSADDLLSIWMVLFGLNLNLVWFELCSLKYWTLNPILASVSFTVSTLEIGVQCLLK